MKIEFYLDKTGYFPKKVYVKIGLAVWRAYENLSNEEIEEIFLQIRKLNKQAYAGLLHLSQHITGKREILHQFILCNWTVLNHEWDISDRQLRFENVDCPFKSNDNCPYKGKGIVCIKCDPINNKESQ